MLALKVSSDSPRLKLRSPGPTSSPAGTKPAMRQSPGSRDVFVNEPPRIIDTAGLKADAPPPAAGVVAGIGSGGAGGGSGGTAASAASALAVLTVSQLLDARFERIDARAVFTLHCLQFGPQRRNVVGGGSHPQASWPARSARPRT